jgi:CspA family cold shock protein
MVGGGLSISLVRGPGRRHEELVVVQGIVKWFSAEKGYGFATVDQGPDVYVHYSVITSQPRELAEGQRIDLEVVAGVHGPMAGAARPV